MKTKFKIWFVGSIILIALSNCGMALYARSYDEKDVAQLEEYLIDFSKKIKGHRLITGSLPFGTDAGKNAAAFFSILDSYYQDKEMIQRVKSYPVGVLNDRDSYILILCDKKSKIILYKDLGETISMVDYPYWREGKNVPCAY